MKRQLLRAWVITLIMLFWYPLNGGAVDKKQTFTVAPFVEYNYLIDMGGAEDLLDGINAGIGGWMNGYSDINLFQHLVLVGAEFRLARPELKKGMELFVSLAGCTGSTGMLDEDYDDRFTLGTIPIIPGGIDIDSIPFVDIEGSVHLRIDQYLDYYIPLQIGVRYEPHPERTLSYFGSLSGGLLFFKGGMDIDIDMAGSVDGITINGETDGTYRGKSQMSSTGWIISALAGARYHWRQDLSSSLALGFGIGRLHDKVDINGTFTGDVSIDSLLADIDTPVSMPINVSESLDLRVDGLRVRLVLVEFKW